ncbi:S1 family peptidase [Actinomycetes bacterium KLBMP 9797]
MRGKTVLRRATAVTATAVLTGALALPQAAPAAPAPLTDVTAAAALAISLGDDRTGGVYYNDAGQLVIAVTDQAAANTVEAAGGVAELVTYSTAQLESIHTALDTDIAFTDPIDGTSWGADPSENQVVVMYDGTVAGEDLARLTAKVDSYGGAARLEYIGGEITSTGSMVGGVGIKENNVAYGRLCTAGFNVQNTNGKKYLLTAGHCMQGGVYWWERWSSGEYIGRNWQHGFSGKDYAVIEYLSGITPYGTILVNGNERQIVASRYPEDAESVQRVGAKSTDLVGTILDPSTTVTYEGATFTRMILTNLCGKRGDSGGPLVRQGTAFGLLSAGNNPDAACSDGVSSARTWFTPVQWVLNTWNLDVY